MCKQIITILKWNFSQHRKAAAVYARYDTIDVIYSKWQDNGDCVGQIPIVDDEMKKAAGDEKEEDIQMTQGIVQKLVTADGTYASQSAFSAPVSYTHLTLPTNREV